MQLQNSFDNGTPGIEITEANSATSGDPVENTGGCYYDGLALLGATGAKVDDFNAGVLGFSLDPNPPSGFTRVAVYIPADFGLAATTNVNLIRLLPAIEPSLGFGMQLNYDGAETPPLFLLLEVEGIFDPVPFVTVLPRESWFRLEIGYQNGNVEGRVALDPFGPHNESKTAVAGLFDFFYCDLAAYNGPFDAGDLHIDEVGFRDTTWWGPFTGGGRRKTRPPRNPRRYQV